MSEEEKMYGYWTKKGECIAVAPSVGELLGKAMESADAEVRKVMAEQIAGIIAWKGNLNRNDMGFTEMLADALIGDAEKLRQSILGEMEKDILDRLKMPSDSPTISTFSTDYVTLMVKRGGRWVKQSETWEKTSKIKCHSCRFWNKEHRISGCRYIGEELLFPGRGGCDNYQSVDDPAPENEWGLVPCQICGCKKAKRVNYWTSADWGVGASSGKLVSYSFCPKCGYSVHEEYTSNNWNKKMAKCWWKEDDERWRVRGSCASGWRPIRAPIPPERSRTA